MNLQISCFSALVNFYIYVEKFDVISVTHRSIPISLNTKVAKIFRIVVNIVFLQFSSLAQSPKYSGVNTKLISQIFSENFSVNVCFFCLLVPTITQHKQCPLTTRTFPKVKQRQLPLDFEPNICLSIMLSSLGCFKIPKGDNWGGRFTYVVSVEDSDSGISRS